MSGRRRPSRIHEGLVGPRALIGTPYLADEALRREYTAEIAPRTRAALGKILGELFGPPHQRREMRVLDVGAGTGAAGEAVRSFCGDAARVVSVDRVAATPGVLVRDVAPPGALDDLGPSFDLVVAAHLLNELHAGSPDERRLAARARLVIGWAQALLAPGGILLLLEPALRETSRDLLAVRDRVLAAGLRVLAPCLWAGPCPALARERDWCHDAVAPAPGSARVDFSYLALGRASEHASAPIDAELFRIVSDPLIEKGRLRIFGCGPAGRHALVRLDRHRSDANAAMDALARGQIARAAGASTASDGLRIGPSTRVSTYVPAE